MPRKRDGFVPLGDVTEAVALPGDRALTHRRKSSVHPDETARAYAAFRYYRDLCEQRSLNRTGFIGGPIP